MTLNKPLEEHTTEELEQLRLRKAYLSAAQLQKVERILQARAKEPDRELARKANRIYLVIAVLTALSLLVAFCAKWG